MLVLGVALWWAAHLFKRVAPGPRARLGEAGKVAVAAALLLSVVLMVIGYRAADGAFYWGRSPAMTGINNLLMLVVFYLFAASGARTAITRRIRHPQLTAFSLWAFSHLLVNGDTASFVLFGGLLAWAVAEIVVINRAQPDWTPPGPAPVRKEVTTIVAAVVAYAAVGAVHWWLGYPPFG